MSKRKSLQVTDTELAVLRVLWQHGKESARGITEKLYPSCSASDFATVHSMLKRLEAKQAIGAYPQSAVAYGSALLHTNELMCARGA